MTHGVVFASAVLLATAAGAAAEPSACKDPFASEGASAEALRTIAEHCRDPQVARLFSNRAEHAERMRDLRLLSRMNRRGMNNDGARLEQCRVYVGLAEAIAAGRWRKGPDVLAALNLAYAQSIHIAERTIRGYDSIVGLPQAGR